MGGVWKSEERERSSFERKEDAQREKGEGDVSRSSGHGPPRFGDGVIGDVLLDLFLVYCSAREGRWGSGTIWNAGGSTGTDVIGTYEAKDHGEDEEEYEGEELRIRG